MLSYDTRKRGTPMESSLDGACQALRETIAQLKDVVPNARLGMSISLNAITPFPQAVETTFGREVSGPFRSVH